MGAICVIFGVSVYYLLPLSLLSQNLRTLLGIFFAILLGMFTGLTLLATNLLGFLELVFVYVLLFWEKKSIRTLLRKNLVLHREKNFMTSLIYALTLGCCIFLLVSASLEVQSMAAEYADAANFDIYADVGGG